MTLRPVYSRMSQKDSINIDVPLHCDMYIIQVSSVCVGVVRSNLKDKGKNRLLRTDSAR